jgi:hypothetical protein
VIVTDEHDQVAIAPPDDYDRSTGQTDDLALS